MNKKRGPENTDIFREIFEKSSASMVLINADEEIVMVNDSFCKMSGYSKEELTGKKWTGKMPHEDIDKLRENNRRRLLKETNLPNEYELRYYTKSGKIKYALVSASLIEKTAQTICTFIDITGRKVIEEEIRVTKENYQSIVEYAGDIIFTMNPEGYFSYISPVSLDKLGYMPEEIIGNPFAPYIHPDDQLYAQQYFGEAILKGEKISELEFRAMHKNGDWRWFSTSASPVFDAEGKITAVIGIGNDITQRKNIELALQRSEKLLWTLFNSIPDMIWLKDSKGVFVACNEAFQRIIGKNNDEIVGKTDYDIVSREVADSVMEIDKKVIADKEVSRNEEKLFFPGINREILLDTIKTPIISDQGELTGVLGIARDISERKQMEEKLSESVTFFRESQRAGLVGSYKFRFDTGIWESSEVLEQIFGIESNEDMDINTWLEVIHPEDQKRITPGLMERIEQKKDFNVEYRIIRKSDKAIRWVHGIGKIIFDDTGKNQFLIGTIQDITQRKLAEEAAFESQTKLAIALKLAHLGPWEYNVDESRFYFTDTFYALFKTTSKKAGGKSLTIEEYTDRFIHPDEGDIVRKEIQKALNSRKSVYISRIEHRMLYANGEEGYLAVQFARIRHRDGKTIKLFGINQDITEVKRAEKELRDSAEELRELNATKDKFFSIIAHDLRSPFSSILGFSELLLLQVEQNKLDKVEMFSQSILGASQLAMELLTNLLEWSRSETGRMEFHPQEINLTDTVNNSIQLLLPVAGQKKINLKLLPDEKIIVVADPDLLSTVFRNLISNAIKFTHENGEVNIVIQEKEKEWLIKVIDNGVGIPEQNIEKMFRIEHNESTLGTNNEKGTGLGLVLCNEFIKKHGGRIWVNSQINKGSEFCFTLPFKVTGS